MSYGGPFNLFYSIALLHAVSPAVAILACLGCVIVTVFDSSFTAHFAVTLFRAPAGAVDTILSYCHNNLADQTLLDLLPYLNEKGVGVISASFSSMGLLRKEVRFSNY